MADKDGKTEKPTPKRLKDARKKGEVPKTPELNIAVSLLIFAFIILPLWEFILQEFLPYLTQMIEQVAEFKVQISDLPKVAIQAVLMILLLASPFMLISVFLGTFINIMQVGLLFTWKPLKPDFKKLNPVNGFKQMIGLRSLVNIAKTLAKLGVIIYLCYQQFMAEIPTIINLNDVGLQKILYFVLDFTRSLIEKISFFLLVVAIFDYGYQRYTHHKSLKMTKQEIKDEFKQQEGDPKVKAQRKAKYQAMSRNAISKVKEATVMVTNPTHYAIAIKYDPQKEGIPLLLAKGADDLAQRMKAEAKKMHVPMIENRPVARAIYAKVEPGEFIPAEMYESVAAIIALVYQLEEKEKNKI
ncbi:flagellar biosynthesis protein FlhB [Liquorilactobacillus hordei]|uniref:Flagellar biosynthetic protein FlhB n=2 Tax=Liquorilactobacillus hordei TaxID=468911 RepID=A0A0A7RFM4_9LACO|nr:flagellar biosynthesis protein FlhB [Liquorilactobacillus hordei]AJA34042.1 flagellar biosynthetic protein FlhB [Liquorilactobacillus hordei]KRL06054.1 bifunctional flagellar biosynthesis protein FliR FlhB [Liquorilactobacillus hordei DSM 19519]MBZ2405942.1 flagellar biosynthesis protein FlhB [Liquorilactobacillus hordei]QYH51335.1 flagellar biosynthesis protein FlhB [Liquorilactobacillus hordei DSM 19519]